MIDFRAEIRRPEQTVRVPLGAKQRLWQSYSYHSYQLSKITFIAARLIAIRIFLTNNFRLANLIACINNK